MNGWISEPYWVLVHVQLSIMMNQSLTAGVVSPLEHDWAACISNILKREERHRKSLIVTYCQDQTVHHFLGNM
jgi:hypothetical protein